MSQETIRKVQLCQLDILEQVDKLCKKHGLTYFAVGGTVLGAVRHQGFIPWDDDMDIAMPREDYEKFLSLAIRELPEQYHLQHFSTEPATPFYFAKVRKSGTLFVEYPVKDLPIHQGVFIDIFPFDAVPDGPWMRKLHHGLCRLAYRLFSCKALKSRIDPSFEKLGVHKRGFRSFARKVLYICMKPLPPRWTFQLVDRCLRMCNGSDTKTVAYSVSRYLIMDKKDIFPLQTALFEGRNVPVPCHYQTYLERKYGDYMSLPPEEKRYGHLPCRVEFEE